MFVGYIDVCRSLGIKLFTGIYIKDLGLHITLLFASKIENCMPFSVDPSTSLL